VVYYKYATSVNVNIVDVVISTRYDISKEESTEPGVADGPLPQPLR